jgi:hypothetical protein
MRYLAHLDESNRHQSKHVQARFCGNLNWHDECSNTNQLMLKSVVTPGGIQHCMMQAGHNL